MHELKDCKSHACDLEDCKIHVYELNECKKSQISCIKVQVFFANSVKIHVLRWRSRVRPSTIMQPCNQLLRIQLKTTEFLPDAGAGMIPAPREPSEIEKRKHDLTHIPFQPWCASCVKGKALAEPHKRIERITEDGEFPTDQNDYLVLKDVAASGGLKVLSMYVKLFGYGTATVVETKGATDTFAVPWVVKMRNVLGLSDSILQCDPEPSLMKWAESAKSKRPERTVIRGSPRRSHQSNAAVDNDLKQF